MLPIWTKCKILSFGKELNVTFTPVSRQNLQNLQNIMKKLESIIVDVKIMSPVL